MSAFAEEIFYNKLVDPEALAVIAREGINPMLLPTPELRVVYDRALDYYFKSGRTAAPTVEVLTVEFGGLLEDHEIDLTYEREETIEWAIETLRSDWVAGMANQFTRALASGVASANANERVDVVHEALDTLMSITFKIEEGSTRVDLRDAIDDSVRGFNERASQIGRQDGIAFGLDGFDTYTNGIHPGELAVVAAPPKTGKSWFLAHVALREHAAGKVVALYTLENSVEMTVDRMACLLAHVSYRDYQRGTLGEYDVKAVEYAATSIKEFETPLWVLSPDYAKRTVDHLVRDASLHDAQVLLIDQLSHIDVVEEDVRRPRYEQVSRIMVRLASLLGQPRTKMPCVLAAQINREGVNAADKLGYLQMHHLAEAAAMERFPDWVFGLYCTRQEREQEYMKLQTLAARRAEPRSWLLDWRPYRGLIEEKHPINNDGTVA